jgi:toxin CcdB
VQFCAYRLPSGRLVLDMQSDVLSDLPGRLVAPLEPLRTGFKAIAILEPVLEIEGQRFVLRTLEMAAIQSKLVSGQPVARLTSDDYAIRRALDLAFSGF